MLSNYTKICPAWKGLSNSLHTNCIYIHLLLVFISFSCPKRLEYLTTPRLWVLPYLRNQMFRWKDSKISYSQIWLRFCLCLLKVSRRPSTLQDSQKLYPLILVQGPLMVLVKLDKQKYIMRNKIYNYQHCKNNYSIWSKKGDRSVKRVKSYSKWSEIYSFEWKFTPFWVRFYSFYRAIPLFIPYFFTLKLIWNYNMVGDVLTLILTL